MSDDATFMREAIELAIEKMQANCGGPFGALVVIDGRVVGRGWNQVTSTNDPTAHAEVVAIIDACANQGAFRIEGATLYTSCEPCPMCLAAAYWARISRICYACEKADAERAGFVDSLLYEELALPHSQRHIPMEQMLREEGNVAMDAWIAKPDKIEY